MSRLWCGLTAEPCIKAGEPASDGIVRPMPIMRCWHDTPEHDYGIVLLGTSLVRITIPRLMYVTHLDP
ncbi:unnamed protein product [Ranitomeya imitator]|uniref:Uncharacterized protein n=1 Tax=Ranitomeya imitator TaxID=111125 RepID=A0ABN9LWN9_9NEOB|nr:unnamed protein product [Ranitomeya imitator]